MTYNPTSFLIIWKVHKNKYIYFRALFAIKNKITIFPPNQ